MKIKLSDFGSRDFSEIYQKFAESDGRLNEAYEIARTNSKGNIWIIGGYVYRNLARMIYDEKNHYSLENIDIDLLVEEPGKTFNLSEEWKVKWTPFSNLRFTKGRRKIDLNLLQSLQWLWARNLNRPHTIYDFLENTALNIQSIVFDFGKKEIEGDIGMQAIRMAKVFVNNHQSARFQAMTKGISIDELIMQKAHEIGFYYDKKRVIQTDSYLK